MRNRFEIKEKIQILKNNLEQMKEEKNMGYMTEDLALEEKIKLLEWVLTDDNIKW